MPEIKTQRERVAKGEWGRRLFAPVLPLLVMASNESSKVFFFYFFVSGELSFNNNNSMANLFFTSRKSFFPWCFLILSDRFITMFLVFGHFAYFICSIIAPSKQGQAENNRAERENLKLLPQPHLTTLAFGSS